VVVTLARHITLYLQQGAVILIKLVNTLFYLFAVLCITSCATTFDIKDGNYSILKNHLRADSKDETIYLFQRFNSTELDEGMFTSQTDSEYRVPSGKSTIVVQMIHSPNKVKWGSSHVSGVRSYQEFFNFDIDLKHMDTYQAESKIEVGGRAYVWLVDNNGTKVTKSESKILKQAPRYVPEIYVPVIIK